MALEQRLLARMARDRLTRFLLVVASILGLIGLLPALVDAHAVFVGAPASVVADTDVALTMNVPNERDDTTYNVGVAIRLPQGWTGVTCQNKPTWTCSIGAESGLDVIRFDKDPNAAPAEDETFRITTHSGTTPGVVSFPTLQTYNTAEVVAWIGPAGSAEPAPTLEVTGASSPTTQVAAIPTVASTTVAPTTVAPPTAAPTTSTMAPSVTTSMTTIAAPPTTVLTATTTTMLPSSSTSSTEAARATTTTAILSTSTELTLAPTAAISDASSSSDSGHSGLIVVVLVLIAASAGGFVYLRRRSQE